MNIQPGWEGLVYGVLVAAAITFCAVTVAVAFGLRGVVRMFRPMTTLGLGVCLPVAAVLVLAGTVGYFEIKHIQHPTTHTPARSVPTAPPSTVAPTEGRIETTVTEVRDAPDGQIILVVRAPLAGAAPCTARISVGTVFTTTDTHDVRLSLRVVVPVELNDPFGTCGEGTQDVTIAPGPREAPDTVRVGQQVFQRGTDGTWTEGAG